MTAAGTVKVTVCLAEMGETLPDLARDSGICARYGGEEFAVILPLTDSHEAGEIADRMRIELAKQHPV
jgi:diguanylate cyclase (GGDEF)-like protein